MHRYIGTHIAGHCTQIGKAAAYQLRSGESVHQALRSEGEAFPQHSKAFCIGCFVALRFQRGAGYIGTR